MRENSPVSQNDLEFKSSMTEYIERSSRVNARIDSLLGEYGIVAADVEEDAHAAINEQIIRVSLSSLVRSSQELGPTDELYALKRETLITLLGDGHLTIDSAWVDLINGFVIPEKPVAFDENTFAEITKKREASEATRALVQQDIEQWFESLTAEEREAFERDEGE